jgi:phage baseplate assembly protein W
MATPKRPTILYRGFSTAKYETKGGTFSTSNIETVKRDLLNHIWTEIGERLMMPNFGTRIPTLAFEPCDEQTKSIVEEDIRKVINYDPRVKLINLEVVGLPDNNAIIAFVDIEYIELNILDTLHIEIGTNK